MESQIVYRFIMSGYLPFVIGGAAVSMLLATCMFKAAARSAKRRRYLRSPVSKIDRMEGSEFEEFLAAYFENEGYRVKVTGGKGDYGADLIIRKGRVRTAVQAKRYKSRVGISAVQEVIGAKAYYHTDGCMVATNSYFTRAAKKLAKEAGVMLWDRNDLMKLKNP